MSFTQGLKKVAKSEKEKEHEAQVAGRWSILHPVAAGIYSGKKAKKGEGLRRGLTTGGSAALGGLGGYLLGGVASHALIRRAINKNPSPLALFAAAAPAVLGGITGSYYGGKAGHKKGEKD